MIKQNSMIENRPSDHSSSTKPISEFWQGVKDCVPTLLGYLSIGFAAGVLEKTAGMSLMEIALISILLYAGSGQFIAAGMLMTSQPVFAIIFTIFFVNLRHLLMSAAIAPYFKDQPLRHNVGIGSLLTDETFGVAMNHLIKKPASTHWMHGLNIAAYVNWIIANILGGLFGGWIANPEEFGFNMALPAMFIGLLVLQMIARQKFRVDLFVAGAAVLGVVLVYWLFPGSYSIIVAAIFAAFIGMAVEKWTSD